MKEKVALARAKQALAPQIEDYCPPEVPARFDLEDRPTEAIGWLVGQAYVGYLMADGLTEEKAKEIVTDLASSSAVSLDVIVPDEATASEPTASEPTGSEPTDPQPQE